MRQYEPIWNRIKTNKSASLVAPVESHRKIIKAVIKEKHQDDGFKLQLAEKALTAKLIISKDITKPKLLMFSLQFHIKDSDIGVEDL